MSLNLDRPVRSPVATLLLLVLLAAGAPSLAAEEAGKEGTLIAGDAACYAWFGRVVAFSDDTVLVGAPNDPHRDVRKGAAYVFVQAANGSWAEQAKLTASDASAYSELGTSVAVSGDTALVGAPGDGDRGQGSAYVFTREGSGAWTEQAKLTASDTYAFGEAVALSSTRALVSSRGDRNSVHVFEQDPGGAWVEEARLSKDDFPSEGFGSSLALSGGTLLVGAFNAAGGAGSAYVFTMDSGGSWVQQARLTASDASPLDYFGRSVALVGDTALVGAPEVDDFGLESGSVYVFAPDASGAWLEQAELTASDAGAFDYFGFSVALSSERAVVGAPHYDDRDIASGSAYVFVRDGSGAWVEQTKLTLDDAVFREAFGVSVAIAETTAVVGAPWHDHGCTNTGAAQVVEVMPVAVDVVPLGPTDLPMGGTFSYRLTVTNPSAASVDVEGRVLARAPSAERLLVGPIALVLGPGDARTQSFTQTLPPAFTGTFELIGQAVTAAGTVEDTVLYSVQ